MFSRVRQIQLAILIPIGFLLVRAIYAFLFGGARNGEILLLDLPSIDLQGPFAHVSLLGPLYLDGLLRNISSALPFSFFMLVIGLAMVLVRPTHVFSLANKLPAFRSLLTALAIGWVQIPALLHAANRVGVAIRLRREKRIRALLPILETAIGTSLAIAQRLAIARRSDLSAASRLEMKEVSIVEADLSGINLEVGAGECLVLSGPTGSGKSSLLLAATGMASELGLNTAGKILVPGSIGFVSQQCREQLFGPLVSDEISSTKDFGLDLKISTPVHLLSEGEAIQVSVVRELQKQPQLLILDEPLAGLDAASTLELLGLLQNYLAGGGALLIAEHRPTGLAGIVTASYHIANGTLASGNWSPELAKVGRTLALAPSDEVFRFEAGSVGGVGHVLIQNPRLTISQSEAIAITGANGAGKTSLLTAMTAASKDIVLVPELVADFFVTTSLEAELERADQLARVEKGFTKASLVSILGFVPALQTHPRDLSAGTQLALAIAMQLSHKPKVLLIDEPTKGFDPQVKAQVIATLECVRETGCAVVFATHDQELIDQLATSVYEISGNQLREIGKVLA
jgi:energy-coupling factor transport system ATP-binding protein